MLPRVEWSDKTLLSIFILDKTFALAFRDNKEVAIIFALLNFDLLWGRHDELNFGDDKVFDFLIESKNYVLLKLLREDKSGDFLFERGTDHSKKLPQLILMIQRLLNVLQITDDPILDLLRQLHIFHSRICCVNLPLKLCRLLIQIRYDQRHIAKNTRINNGSNRDKAGYECYLEGSNWRHIIACQDQHSVVDRDEVAMNQGVIVEVGLWVSSVQRRHPILIEHDYDVPETPQTVNVDNDHEDELEKFERILRVLLHIHALDNASQPRNSHQLEQLEKLEKLAGCVRENHREIVKRHCG